VDRKQGIRLNTVWRVGFVAAVVGALNSPYPAFAHASEQGFVLLLPTDIYIPFGVAAVALTVVILAFLPAARTSKLFTRKTVGQPRPKGFDVITSLTTLAVLSALVMVGLFGPRDPLANLLPLMIWTAWWIVVVVLQGLGGDLWHWLNPWIGLYHLLVKASGLKPLSHLPNRLGIWPGVAAFLGFMSFALADIAPDDPARLAWFVSGYWFYTLVGMIIFGGDNWLSRCECFTILLRHFSTLALFQRHKNGLQLSTPGAPLIKARALSLSGGVFVLLILGSGTFDGLNETFWWLGQIGVNPLAFPGRSAVVGQTLAGLVGANVALLLAFVCTLYLGLWLVGERARFSEAFGRLVRAILPIALAYHAAHFLSALLVNGQYIIKALSDPLARGADYLGLGTFHVTTGFFNSRDSVEIIWLSQAGIIVVGHIVAVLISHAIAIDMFGNAKKTTLSQIPLAAFMILYTLLGLTLLAAPRGA
jgi:hypothetical protein